MWPPGLSGLSKSTTPKSLTERSARDFSIRCERRSALTRPGCAAPGSGRPAAMSALISRVTAAAGGAAAVTAVGSFLAVRGDLTLDVGWGRTRRPLGPFGVDIAAPQQVVFTVIADPYLARTPHAMAAKLQVIERGSDMVLAAHHTHLNKRLRATTVETVRFARPDLVAFRLVRGPVPGVTETFQLSATGTGTRLA